MPQPRSPAVVKHRSFRDIERLLIDANDAALGLLVGDRLARHALTGRLPEAAGRKLSELYSQTDVPDIDRFDFVVQGALNKLTAAERELALMAVPFAVSLFNEYLVVAAQFLELGNVARPPQSADDMMLGAVKHHLESRGVSSIGEQAELLRVVLKARNRIIHRGATPGQELIASWQSTSPAAKAAWEGVTGRAMPFRGPRDRLPWEGPEIRGVFAVTGNNLRQINVELQRVLPRQFWADLVIHELWTEQPTRALNAQAQTGSALLTFANSRGYRALTFTAGEMTAAADRAPHMGLTPELRPYWRRASSPSAALTRRVSAADLRNGTIRFAGQAKQLLPAALTSLTAEIRTESVRCTYDPRLRGTHTRSGVLRIRPETLQRLVVAGQALTIVGSAPGFIILQ